MDFIEFGTVATFRNGLNFGKESRGQGCLIIGIPDFKDRMTPDFESLKEINIDGIVSEDDFVKKNDILFVRSNGNKNLVGRSLFINKDHKAVFSGFCIRARMNSRLVDPRFCFYFTRTASFKSQISTSSGTNIQNLNQEILTKVKIPLFPLETQEAIVNILSSIDSKIETNNRINAELEAMAKTIYDYWFVQFDFPDKKGKPYKASGGKMVWSEELKRHIPEGWEVDKLSSKLRIVSGFPFDSDTYVNNGQYKVITIKNVQDGKLDSAKVDFVNQIPKRLPDWAKLRDGDVLISLTGNVGRICLVAEENLLLNQRVGKFICAVLTKAFFYFMFQRRDTQSSLEKLATGTSQKNLSPIDTGEMKVLLPEDHMLMKFDALVTPSLNKIISNHKENQKLIELRDWLLPMLMNGQIKIKDAERELAMAAEADELYPKRMKTR